MVGPFLISDTFSISEEFALGQRPGNVISG